MYRYNQCTFITPNLCTCCVAVHGSDNERRGSTLQQWHAGVRVSACVGMKACVWKCESVHVRVSV